MPDTILTIGHSTHSVDEFLALLRNSEVSAVADVRSVPYSRFNPQFNRENLQSELKRHGIKYVFLGKELGARSEDRRCYEGGKVQYERLCNTPEFIEGLDRLQQGAASYKIAMMCAEKDPLDCHRTILVARHLVERGLLVDHILPDGKIETHEDLLSRLLELLNLEDRDLLRSREETIEIAYKIRGESIAFEEELSHEASVELER